MAEWMRTTERLADVVSGGILIVICVVAVIGILAFAPGMVGGEPVWLFRRRKK